MSKRKKSRDDRSQSDNVTALNPLQDAFIKLDQAEKLRMEGKLNRALDICLALLKKFPDYMAALHTAGLVHAGMGNHQQALNCLVRAAMHYPHSLPTLTALSGVYLELGATEMAAYTLEQAKAIDSKNANVLVTLGEIYRAEMEFELARETFARALEIEADLTAARAGYGWACSLLGENTEAVAAFEGILAGGNRLFEPLSALAALPASLLNINLMEELEKYLRESDQSDADETMISFIRAAALDKAGRYSEAWETLVKANRAVLNGIKGNAKRMFERQNRTLQLLRSNPVRPANEGVDDRYPITLFILGPSRSGKTSLEELVACLPGVKRGYENPCVDTSIRHSFQGAGLLTNRYFEVLPPQLYSQCRALYTKELMRRAGSARVFTNTHPERMHDAALMSINFPNVRFMFVKRNPDDVALRIFMRHYQMDNAYSYDMGMIREHIAWYYEMMDLMAEKLPEHVRIINYEDMVENPAQTLGAAAGLCGLQMPDRPVPAVGDDRGCAAPYRDFMAKVS